MKHIPNREIVRLGGAHIIADWNNLFRSSIVLDKDGGAFGGGDDDAAAKAAAEKAAAEKAAAEKAAAEKAAAGEGEKPSDAEAKLLKEVMKKKEQVEALEAKLKSFDGINPEEIKSLLAEKKEAEKAKKEAEKKAVEAAGDIERLKTMMAEEHKKELETVQSQLADLQKLVAQKDSAINDLTIGQSFANSKFISDELVLTPTKAKQVYGGHFGYEDGKIVAYDKPSGVAERTKIVDARGEPLGFEAALKKLIEADPDRDYVLKSKMATGANSKTSSSQSKGEDVSDGELRGAARISAILSKGGSFASARK